MKLEKKLRTIQDNLRNAGWRIQHIPWQPKGKLEWYGPDNFLSWLLILAGFAGFFGGIPLLSNNMVSTPAGIAIMISGLALLFLSRFSTGYFLYRSYVRVDARCLDREIQEFEDFESSGSLIKKTFWAPRLLCEYTYKGQNYTVTPIIVKMTAFNKKGDVERFLEQRIDLQHHCTLWINPKVPLQTFFRVKPRTGPYTV